MSANDDIQDALTRHQIFVLRYAKGREKEAAKAIETAIRQGIERLEQVSESGRAIAENNIRELNAYLIELNDEYAETFSQQIKEFGAYEAGVNTQILEKAVNVSLSAPAPAQLEQAIFSNIMSIEPTKGYSVGSILEQFGQNNANTVSTIAREAILLGKSNQQLTQDIMDIIPTQKRKAETLARTITNHTANTARNETMKENADVLDGYKWLATLDSRTSLVCASRDGIVYPVDDRSPKPPAHFNCRSTITFVVNPEYDLGADIEGTRPSKGDSKQDVSSDLTYDQWLRKQSPEFQNEVLGRKRAQLFREGATLDKFVDERGKTLSLSELQAKDGAFGVATPPQIIPKVSFDDINVTKDFTAAEFSDYLDETLSPDLKRLALQVRTPKRIIDNEGKQRAWYSYVSRDLHMTRQDQNLTKITFAHEYGHHIDAEMRWEESGKMGPWSAKNVPFQKAWAEDRKNLGLRAAKTKQKVVDQAIEALFDLVDAEYQGYKYKRKVPKAPWSVMVSDIFDSMSEGSMRKKGAWGHGASYFKGSSKYEETFANLVACRGNPEAWSYISKNFPLLAEQFDELVQKFLESKGGI